MIRSCFLYTTWHGSVPKFAEQIASRLECEADMFDIIRNPEAIPESMDSYDMIIYGTSVHDGVLPDQFKEFVSSHAPKQEFRVTGLFVLSIKGTDITKQVLEKELPEGVRKQLSPVGYLDGRLLKEKLNFFERRILRLMSAKEVKMVTLGDIKIRKFSQELLAELENKAVEKKVAADRKKNHYKPRNVSAKQGFEKAPN